MSSLWRSEKIWRWDWKTRKSICIYFLVTHKFISKFLFFFYLAHLSLIKEKRVSLIIQRRTINLLFLSPSIVLILVDLDVHLLQLPALLEGHLSLDRLTWWSPKVNTRQLLSGYMALETMVRGKLVFTFLLPLASLFKFRLFQYIFVSLSDLLGGCWSIIQQLNTSTLKYWLLPIQTC